MITVESNLIKLLLATQNPNGAKECVSVLLRIQDVASLNLGPEISSPGRNFLCLSSVPTCKFRSTVSHCMSPMFIDVFLLRNIIS